MSEIVAFLFPGQGRVPKQLPETSARLEPLVQQTLEQGLRLADWMEAEQEERLRQTDAAQPALLLDNLSREEMLRDAGWGPNVVAGHSLGEYGALVSANVLTPSDAMEAVLLRGRLMQGVVGTMAAIVKLTLDEVSALCKQIGPDVVVANHNGPTQVVVSGTDEAVAALGRQAESAGARVIPLKVSGPFHSPRMLPAQQAVADLLEQLTFSPPSVPVISAVSGEIVEDAGELKTLLRGQITAPVRWVDVLLRLETFGVTKAIEVGAGDVLTKLGRRAGMDIRFLTHEEAMDER